MVLRAGVAGDIAELRNFDRLIPWRLDSAVGATPGGPRILKVLAEGNPKIRYNQCLIQIAHLAEGNPKRVKSEDSLRWAAV